MSRYEGESPFQTRGLVWAHGRGLLLLDDDARQITVKPDLPFSFDALYAEPTLCHLVANEAERPLSQAEIAHVAAYLARWAAEPHLCAGVDVEGRYLEGVTRDHVVRTVDTPPPPGGLWRFDFSKGPGDHWIQAWGVDAAGAPIDGVDETHAAAVVTEPPPMPRWGEVWRWDRTTRAWRVARLPADILQAHRRRKIQDAWLHLQMRLEESEHVTIAISGNLHQLGCDRETRETVIALNTAIARNVPLANPRPWFFKGNTAPTLVTHDDLAAMGAAILARQDALYTVYFAQKAAISAMADVSAVAAYDVTTGYDS